MLVIHLEIDGGGPRRLGTRHRLAKETCPDASRAHDRDHVELFEPSATATVLEGPGVREVGNAHWAHVARHEELTSRRILEGATNGGSKCTTG